MYIFGVYRGCSQRHGSITALGMAELALVDAQVSKEASVSGKRDRLTSERGL